MKKEELIKNLKDIEWEDFEVKEAKSEIPKNSLETVSAFSNSAGGWLIFGVKKEGKNYEIIGVSSPQKIEQEFIGLLRNGTKFNKNIDVRSRKYSFQGKVVLAFYIPSSKRKPVFYDNPKNTFLRNGSGDQRATQEELNSLFRDSAFGTKDQELTNFKIQDLNKETIQRYRTYLKNVRPEHQYNALSDSEFLEKLRVLENSQVTLGGLLFFGTPSAIGKYIPDFRIDYLEIFGTSYSDAENRYEFRLSEYSNIYEYFFAIYERLIKKIDIPFKLKGAFRDENQPQVKAIREALVNLLMHSDYFSPMKPRIRVFLDRIEFLNPGALPKPLEELRKGDISLPRNPIIAKIFRIIDLAENAGYGFDKMFKGWTAYYSREPVVLSGIDYYRIEFFFKDNVPENVPDNVPENVPENRLLSIIKKIIENKKITIPELASYIKVTEKTVKRDIEKLKKDKKIKRTGPDKGGYWEVIANN